ncbi:hypothetical protein F2Q69_00007479 [Brassica cretica]|uniref:Uncharacterized protein n=1 Tax=Brassica cretica TaxID=69181 RepID=A0A8S9P7T7_BRACR|nr:hypothetical protein F2Q69_00007479 [Brassica cretica]
MARSLSEAFVYATSCVIELLCSLLFWIVVVMHEQIVCSIGCLKDICDIFSRYWFFGIGRLSIDVVLLMLIDCGRRVSIDRQISLSIGWLKRVLSQAVAARI